MEPIITILNTVHFHTVLWRVLSILSRILFVVALIMIIPMAFIRLEYAFVVGLVFILLIYIIPYTDKACKLFIECESMVLEAIEKSIDDYERERDGNG